jgi:hypothetical protein
MFDSSQISTGRQYTLTATLLLIAFVVTPVILILSRPFAHVSVAFALGLSGGCVALAWLTWTRFSRLSIPSLGNPFRRSR